jgi:spermidine synthase
MAEEFPSVVPYHLYVPSFGDWGFNLAFNAPAPHADLRLARTLALSYLNEENFGALFVFANDERADLKKLAVNTLTRPSLPRYYTNETMEW